MNNLNKDEITVLFNQAMIQAEETFNMSDHYYWKGRADGYRTVLAMIDNRDRSISRDTST